MALLRTSSLKDPLPLLLNFRQSKSILPFLTKAALCFTKFDNSRLLKSSSLEMDRKFQINFGSPPWRGLSASSGHPGQVPQEGWYIAFPRLGVSVSAGSFCWRAADNIAVNMKVTGV